MHESLIMDQMGRNLFETYSVKRSLLILKFVSIN